MKLSNVFVSSIIIISPPVDGFMRGILFESMREYRTPKNKSFTKRNVLPIEGVGDTSNLMKVTGSAPMINIFSRISNNPLIESNFLNDMGHILLDVLSLSPSSQIKSRIITILGRISFIASDYIPDHTINPDELFFQILMLVVSLSGLIRDLFLIRTKIYSSSFRDKRIFVRYFRNSGLSWNMYKILFSSAFQWVEIKPFTTVHLKELRKKDYNFLWVYNGTIEAGINDSMLKQFEQNSILESDSSHIILRSGKTGAYLLRINLKYMSELMKMDYFINDSCRSFILNLLKGRTSKIYYTY